MNDRYFILDGHKAIVCEDPMTWAKSFEDADSRVAKTDMGKLFKTNRFEPVMVSTVFLGLNHRWDDGPPLIFETMIFGGEFDQEQWRYSTWEEAEEGHKRAVKKVRVGC